MENNMANKYQKYVKAWEQEACLKQWIAPLAGDDHAVYCKVCRRPLYPNKKDLIKHSKSIKHIKNMSIYNDVMLSCQPFKEADTGTVEYKVHSGPVLERNESAVSTELHLQHVTQQSANRDVTVPICPEGEAHLCSLLDIPEFQGWLKVDNGDLKCSVCKKEMKPSKTFLLRHASGRIHRRKCSRKSIQQPVSKVCFINENDCKISAILGNDSLQLVERIIDLRSDTVTKPNMGMKEAMMNAEVGDDAYGSDPVVKELEVRVARTLGKERGLFVPSGTMANLIAVITHCWSRDAEVIVGDQSHLYNWSQGSFTRLCGIAMRAIKNESDGTFSLETLKEMIQQGKNLICPIQTVVCIENTHNRVGGKVLPMDWLLSLGKFCEDNGILLHMDGARLMNACIHKNSSPDAMVQHCHSSSFCFNKSLGAPMGSALVGEADFIARAKMIRTFVGGTMHQAGIFASAALYALEHTAIKLHLDHCNARAIAQTVSEMKSSAVRVELDDVHTNIVHLYTDNIRVNAQELCDRLATVREKEVQDLKFEAKLLLKPITSSVARIVTHCDMSTSDMNIIAKKLKYVIEEYDNMLNLNVNKL